MKVKVKVKSLAIERTQNPQSLQDDIKYKFRFSGCDTFCVADKKYQLAINGNANNPIYFDETKEYDSVKNIFDFISAHSKETLIIEIHGTEVIRAELIYG